MIRTEDILIFEPHGHGSKSEGKVDGITVVEIIKNTTHTHTNTDVYTVLVFDKKLDAPFRTIDQARAAALVAFARRALLALNDETITLTMSTIGPRPFHTGHFIDSLRTSRPNLWKAIVDRYGEGGRGARTNYSAFSAVAHTLNRAANRGILDKLNTYFPAPPNLNWGSPIIRYWTGPGGFSDHPYPDEPTAEADYVEGAVTQVKVNRYERSTGARAACLSHHGTVCRGCDMEFVKVYGERGRDFIHVHHLIPLNTIKKSYKVDPINDLVPVCPNCHAMIHRREPMLTIEELRTIVSGMG